MRVSLRVLFSVVAFIASSAVQGSDTKVRPRVRFSDSGPYIGLGLHSVTSLERGREFHLKFRVDEEDWKRQQISFELKGPLSRSTTLGGGVMIRQISTVIEPALLIGSETRQENFELKVSSAYFTKGGFVLTTETFFHSDKRYLLGVYTDNFGMGPVIKTVMPIFWERLLKGHRVEVILGFMYEIDSGNFREVTHFRLLPRKKTS